MACLLIPEPACAGNAAADSQVWRHVPAQIAGGDDDFGFKKFIFAASRMIVSLLIYGRSNNNTSVGPSAVSVTAASFSMRAPSPALSRTPLTSTLPRATCT